MTPLRLIVVAACPFPCARGTPVRILRLTEAIARRGHDVHVVTYHLGDDEPNLPFTIHRTPSLPIYQRRSPGPSWRKLLLVDPLLLRLLGRVLRDHPADVVHAHHYEGLAVAMATARRGSARIVYDAHTLLASELPFYALGLPERLKVAGGRWLDARLPRRADHVIAVTQAIRDGLIGRFGVSPERVTVVNNGIEAGHFGPRHPPPEGVAPTLVFTGNLAPYQGIELMLHAFRRVLDRRPDVRLRIVSNASFRPYEALAGALGVRRSMDLASADFQSLPAHVSDAAVALNPRVKCEGIPQKLMNYMAAGLPIVSFAGSAEPLDDGVTARVVPDGRIDAFADAVLELLAHPNRAARLGDGALRASHEYSWDRSAEAAEGVYEKVLARAPSLRRRRAASSTDSEPPPLRSGAGQP